MDAWARLTRFVRGIGGALCSLLALFWFGTVQLTAVLPLKYSWHAGELLILNATSRFRRNLVLVSGLQLDRVASLCLASVKDTIHAHLRKCYSRLSMHREVAVVSISAKVCTVQFSHGSE